jgi:hypothetical protein
MSLMNTKKDSKPASLQSHIRIELTNRTTSSSFTVYSVPSNIYTRFPESIQNDLLQKTVYSSVEELLRTACVNRQPRCVPTTRFSSVNEG